MSGCKTAFIKTAGVLGEPVVEKELLDFNKKDIVLCPSVMV